MSKKGLISLCLTVAVSTHCLGNSTLTTEDRALLVTLHSGHAPWSIEEENGEIKGYIAEYFEVTLKELGYNSKFRSMPSARIMLESTMLHSDLTVYPSAFLAVPTQADIMHCSEPFLTIDYSIYTHSDTEKIGNVGVTRSRAQSGPLWLEADKGYEVVTYTSPTLMFRALKARRIDSIVSNRSEVEYWEQALNFKTRRFVPTAASMGISACFSIPRLGSKNASYLAANFGHTLHATVKNKPHLFTLEAIAAAQKNIPNIENGQ